jgi:soluble P-type ATPase
MLPIRDFVGALAVAGKPFKEIEETVKKIYGDKVLKKTQLYEIIRKVKEGKPAADQRLFNCKCRIRDPTVIANIAAQVAHDRRVTVRRLAEAYGVSTRTIHATLHDDLHLSKKSAR